MPYILAPLELLLGLALIYGLFYLFRKLLSSRRLNKVIAEVANPEPVSDDEIIEEIDRTKKAAATRVVETCADIERRRLKNEAMRKAYGG